MAVNRIRGAFQVPRKGEVYELRAGLVSQYAYERKEAIQKTIQSMTLGKDVSALFPDVLKNVATGDLDQKKLVYLYLMNYAKSHPDLCILAVNTFVQDAEDPNPLIRALAIRTMGCIRVEKMVDYMEDPLRKTLRDESPYVRKTAAICVAKLFDLNPSMCLENGFLESLQEMIGDPNPMVVANAVAALGEIHEAAPDTNALQVTPVLLKKMLMALNECTEWGRITILTTLADYRAADAKESEHICERVSPQFQHVNPSVVLSAVKVVFLHQTNIGHELSISYLKKMAPPLVTLVSSAPEVQWVALRNIDLLLQRQPDILSKEMRVFFCKYNDPPYLKLQKIEIMVRISNDRNVEQLLAELKEYAMEVDMDFVRRAVKAIGQVAIKIETATEKCVNALLDLIATKVHYVVQEAIVVIKDIFRKYPGYEGIIPTLCQCIDELDEPNARSAIIWIVGEYAEKISNAGDVLASFVEGFSEEFPQVQLQILTAVVKLFLKRPEQSQGLVQKVLQASTTGNDNPDIRDRAYVYWRLLSSDPSVTKNVVLSERPPIDTTIQSLPPALLNELLRELSTLASVYHKPASTFLGAGRHASDAVQKAAIEEQRQNALDNPVAAAAMATAISGQAESSQVTNAENLLDIDFDGSAPASLQKQPSTGGSGLEGLAGTPQRVESPAPPPPPPKTNADDLADIFGNSNGSTAPPPMAGMPSDDDLMNGFASMQMNGASKQPPPPAQQLQVSASKYLFGNPSSKETIIEISQGQLYLVRPLSPKGYSELIFPDANCSIRRTGQPFQYQIVVQRVYEEGEEELTAGDEDEDEATATANAEKDERTFLLDEALRFRSDEREGGEVVFAWRDLSGDAGDLYEFVCDTSVQVGTVASFEAVALQCQYERKYRKSRETATEEDLAQFSFSGQTIPETGIEATPQAVVAATPSPKRSTKSTKSESPMASTTKEKNKFVAPPSAKHPEGKEILASETAELHAFEFESGTFVEQDAEVTAIVSEVGNWDYWLQISGGKRDWLGLPVAPELNPVFNFEYRSFIFNHYTEDGSAYSWLLRFKDQEVMERFQEGLMRALWEHLNQAKWQKAKDMEREYALEAFQDLTMEDAPPYEEDEEEEPPEEEESDDGARSEHYDTDEEQDDVTGQPKDKDVNSQLAVGFKNDRTFVVRGSKIGVFKHGTGNNLDFQTNINKVATPKGKLFSPKKVMLHAQDRDMILQNPGDDNSLYRMDLEYGKIVDEYKVHEDIPVNTFAPETKYAQTTSEPTFLGLSHNALYRIDPRLAGSKLVDSDMKQYASRNGFTSAATTAAGHIAVASTKGDVRMFDRLGINAKTHIPALGDPIIGLDVSADGRWLLATTRTYLLLVDCLQKTGKNAGKLGFEKSFAKDDKPTPRRLGLTPAHVAQLSQETRTGISFTPARFNAGEGSNETSIVTATGPFVVAWSMKKLLKGTKDPYSIKRYSEQVKADDFRYGTDKNFIVATENQVGMERKSALQRPTRESIVGGTRSSSSSAGGGGGGKVMVSTPARKAGARGSHLRNEIVDSPY